MNDVDLDESEKQEIAAYKEHSASAKFRQQVSYGIGAAMVFGLVSAVANMLFHAATVALAAPAVAASSIALPIIGLVALGFAGVGLLYLSAKFLSENTLVDQQMQAKQINCATRSKAPAVEAAVTTPTQTFLNVAESKAEPAPAMVPQTMAMPTSTVGNERELADTITPRVQANAKEPAEKWTTQVQANDNNQLSRAV